MRKRCLPKISVGLIAIAAGVAAVAQAPAASTEKLAFEVASGKPAPSIAGPAAFSFAGSKGGPGTNDPGRWTCTDCRLWQLITLAHDVKAYQVTVPNWAENESYDIAAKVPAGTTKEQVGLMIQNLLAERFKLTFHRDQKEAAVYNLVIANGALPIQVQLGLKLESKKENVEMLVVDHAEKTPTEN